MRRSLIIDTTARLVFPSVLVIALYLLVSGHNEPGGGFVGGLVAGAAIALVYAAGGIDDVRSLSRVPPWTVLGTGLLVSAATAIGPLLLGDALMEHGYVELDVPVFDHLKLTSTLLFDAGVDLVVIGLVLMVLEAFGDEVRPPRDTGDGERPKVGVR